MSNGSKNLGRVIFVDDIEEWWMDNTTGQIHNINTCAMSKIRPMDFDSGQCTCKEHEPSIMIKLKFFDRRLNGL